MVLPGALAAAALVAASGVFWHRRNVRWLLMGAAVAIVATVAAASARQRMDGPSAGSQDVAIIIDASSSMTVRHDGKSSFERALAEATRPA
jgi:chromate transport protein ChrA